MGDSLAHKTNIPHVLGPARPSPYPGPRLTFMQSRRQACHVCVEEMKAQ